MDTLVVIFVVFAVVAVACAVRRKPGRRPAGAAWSQRDVEAIAASAESMVRVVNESMKIAASTGNPETKESRVRVATQNLERLKTMRQTYPFLTLKDLAAVEADLARLKLESELRDYAAMADGNGKGEALEKKGRLDEAIAVYERMAAEGVDTPFTYRRLAIIYRKRKDPDSELRALDRACANVPSKNAQHHAWFVERRQKLRAKLGR